jgi:hypothetical protein
MRRLLRYILCGLSAALLLGACAGDNTATPVFVTTPVPGGAPQFSAPTSQAGSYPAPSGGPAAGYPAPAQAGTSSSDGRIQSALTSYKVAADTAAKDYNPDARLYGIIPSRIMIGNLGGPPVKLGWFYKFKTPGSPREYIIQVVDAVVSGTTQAEPLGEIKPAELPIDVSQLKLDSDKVLKQFQEVAKTRGINTEGVIYDLELANLEGSGGPTWSVVDPASKKWLYSINAISGQEVSDPHQGS